MTKQASGWGGRAGRWRVSRRRFAASVGAAAAAFSLAPATRVRGYGANSKVSLGLIGCGHRGGWIAELFRRHGGYHFAAAADYFPDRVDQVGDQLQIPASRRFTGLSGYRRLLQQDLDAVAIESPPYFHPEQAEAAVSAGKHVYIAKPVAVDPPGCRTIAESGRRATAAGLCFLVDFQTRADKFFIEALRRVRHGAIGRFAFGEATYHANLPWKRQLQYLQQTPLSAENRLRAWGLDRVLSGDIITEQNIHALDVASWIMDEPPERAYGTGGQMVRDFGTCWDTFSVLFQYSNNVGVTFSSRQFDGYGSKPDGIRNRMFGADGVLETQYGGQVRILGKRPYEGGSSPDIFKQGVVANIAAFHAAIQKGDCSNPTVAPAVRSNLVTILGRTAAYERQVVSWEEILHSDEKLEADLKGLKR